ncbi:peptidylprolyl isomerase [Microbulbifer pacificus]|uniref:peptidylprolyl isomerase n=1 Tax=Microbulbifer pacificus TaxID=407164 RepID=UPI000CF4818B|nr:peptidylprolyl isomerase [Microbulbifer pacificus]
MQKKWLWALPPLVVIALIILLLIERPLPDHLAARIDGEDIPVDALDVFVAAARHRQQDANRETVFKALLENRLLANWFRQQPSKDITSRVGYDRQTQLEQQLFRLIRSAYSERLQETMNKREIRNSLDFLVTPLAFDRESLAPVLKLQQQLYSSMTPEQQMQAQQLVIARYRFHHRQPEQQLTLWDLYRRQNVQLKVQMHNLNLEFIREAIRQQLTTAFVLDWFAQHSGLSEQSRKAIQRCVEDALIREAGLQQMGLLQDIHDDNPGLRDKAKQISADEIADYYQSHRQEFTRVERVHAYHIRLQSQQAADRVYQEIVSGLPFTDAVSRYSVAPDKARGGALGWIDRRSRADHWSKALAFVQTPAQVSRPFRSPQGGDEIYWEILLVDQRETGFQPVDSESVHYRASHAIAREKLQQQYYQLLNEIRDTTDVRINRRQLPCESC